MNVSRHTLVIGSGASAVTCLSMLQRLGVAVGGVAVTWITRREAGQSPYNIIQVSSFVHDIHTVDVYKKSTFLGFRPWQGCFLGGK